MNRLGHLLVTTGAALLVAGAALAQEAPAIQNAGTMASHNITPEQRSAIREKIREKLKERYQNASPEQQAAIHERIKERLKARYENASPEQKASMMERLRARHGDGGIDMGEGESSPLDGPVTTIPLPAAASAAAPDSN